jgi:predicted RNA-binding protein YlxR (DUF448 family)
LNEKKVPLRMCAICRTLRPKRELIRLVRTAGGEVFLDETGKKPGRGFYVCPEKSCIEQAVKGNRLAKGIGVHVDEDIKLQLKKAVKE